MKQLRFLVTGTGRCGTVFMARLLTSLGIPCGHESIFSFHGMKVASNILMGKRSPCLSHVSGYDILRNRRIPQWVKASDIVAESSYMAAPFLDQELVQEVPVIHVVRHPQRVVSSFIRDFHYFFSRSAGWQDFIYTHVPESEPLSTPIERACCFYVQWNEMIERACENRRHLFHKVEEMPCEALYEFLGVRPSSDVFDNKTVNSKNENRTDFLIDDIPAGKIKDKFISMTRRYGYVPFGSPKLL